MFDVLSHEYGWTTEYILSRTIKEVSWRLDRIVHRKNKDLELEAALRGVKLKKRAKKVELSEDQASAIARAYEEARQRKRK